LIKKKKYNELPNTRTDPLHAQGFSPLHIDKIGDEWIITWTDEIMMIPPRQLTQRAFIDELAQDHNVKIT